MSKRNGPTVATPKPTPAHPAWCDPAQCLEATADQHEGTHHAVALDRGVMTAFVSQRTAPGAEQLVTLLAGEHGPLPTNELQLTLNQAAALAAQLAALIAAARPVVAAPAGCPPWCDPTRCEAEHRASSHFGPQHTIDNGRARAENIVGLQMWRPTPILASEIFGGDETSAESVEFFSTDLTDLTISNAAGEELESRTMTPVMLRQLHTLTGELIAQQDAAKAKPAAAKDTDRTPVNPRRAPKSTDCKTPRSRVTARIEADRAAAL